MVTRERVSPQIHCDWMPVSKPSMRVSWMRFGPLWSRNPALIPIFPFPITRTFRIANGYRTARKVYDPPAGGISLAEEYGQEVYVRTTVGALLSDERWESTWYADSAPPMPSQVVHRVLDPATGAALDVRFAVSDQDGGAAARAFVEQGLLPLDAQGVFAVEEVASAAEARQKAIAAALPILNSPTQPPPARVALHANARIIEHAFSCVKHTACSV